MTSSRFWLLVASFLALRAVPCLAAAVAPTVVPDTTMGPLRPNECWASLCDKAIADQSAEQLLMKVGEQQAAEAGITQTNTPTPTTAAKPSASAAATAATASQPATEVTDYAAMAKSMLASERVAPTGDGDLAQEELPDREAKLAPPAVSTVRPPSETYSPFSYIRHDVYTKKSGTAYEQAGNEAKKSANIHAKIDDANKFNTAPYGDTGSRLFQTN